MGHAGADNPADEFAWQTASGLHCSGRIVLNVWRLMRTGEETRPGLQGVLGCVASDSRCVGCTSCVALQHLNPQSLCTFLCPFGSPAPAELKLTSYSFESCVAAVLQLRVPHVPQAQLHAWFAGGPGAGRWRCLSYWARRARLNLALLDQLDLVGRTGEMARTFGIDFYSGARQEGGVWVSGCSLWWLAGCNASTWLVLRPPNRIPVDRPWSVPSTSRNHAPCLLQCWHGAASTEWRA